MGMRAIRKQHGLSLAQLSTKLGEEGIKVSPDTLAKYERGERNIPLERAQQLAKFYKISLADLYGDQYVADNLRILRAQQGVSLTELSKKLAKQGVKLSPATLSQYEKESVRVSEQRITQLAAVYGIDPAQLYIKHNSNHMPVIPAGNTKQQYSQRREIAKSFIKQATDADLRKLQLMINKRLK